MQETADMRERVERGSEAMGTVLVTGGAKRIGRAISLRLAAAGFDVAIHARSAVSDAEAVAQDIENQGGRAAVVTADLAEDNAAVSLFQQCQAALGPARVVVNNASMFEHDSIGTLTPDLWGRQLDTNLRAPVFLAQALLQQLPEGIEGNVVNLIDQRVCRLTPDFFSYTISKSALRAANTMLAQAMAPKVRVNAVAPGPVLQSIHQSPLDFAEESRSVPLGHGPTPEEIADAVHFILCSKSMTGQMIVIDGGQHLI